MKTNFDVDKMKNIRYFINNNNLFKILSIEEQIEGYDIKKYNDLSDICHLNIIDIKDLICNDFYTGHQYDDYFNWILSNNIYDIQAFKTAIAQHTLGYGYKSNNFIYNKELPHGIGLIFKIVTVSNIIYEFIIKMNLIHLDNDDKLSIFDVNKSMVTIIMQKI